jgi:hypothetical protein
MVLVQMRLRSGLLDQRAFDRVPRRRRQRQHRRQHRRHPLHRQLTGVRGGRHEREAVQEPQELHPPPSLRLGQVKILDQPRLRRPPGQQPGRLQLVHRRQSTRRQRVRDRLDLQTRLDILQRPQLRLLRRRQHQPPLDQRSLQLIENLCDHARHDTSPSGPEQEQRTHPKGESTSTRETSHSPTQRSRRAVTPLVVPMTRPPSVGTGVAKRVTLPTCIRLRTRPLRRSMTTRSPLSADIA